MLKNNHNQLLMIISYDSVFSNESVNIDTVAAKNVMITNILKKITFLFTNFFVKTFI